MLRFEAINRTRLTFLLFLLPATLWLTLFFLLPLLLVLVYSFLQQNVDGGVLWHLTVSHYI